VAVGVLTTCVGKEGWLARPFCQRAHPSQPAPRTKPTATNQAIPESQTDCRLAFGTILLDDNLFTELLKGSVDQRNLVLCLPV
jgi:hypothetical protein